MHTDSKGNLLSGMIACLMLSSSVIASDEHGNQLFHAFTLAVDGGENRDNQSVANWDLDGWVGGDSHKLWLKSEGEVADHDTEHSEIWAMHSYNLDTFWDVQTGVRYDSQPESTGYVVAGLTGLAPHYFETEVHWFVSEDGDVSFRLREENDFLLTQKLILQPYLEMNAYAQDVKELEVGSGLSDVSLGLQLRYDITRKIAPYVEVSYGRLFGDTADYARSSGEDRNDSSITAGIRLMF